MTTPTLKIKVTPTPKIKGKMDVRFPANVDVLSPILLDRTGGSYTFGFDGDAAPISTATQAALDLKLNITAVRERLTGNRTYYVRTDGSNSNTGLVNTSDGAFLTIQKAVDVVLTSIDLAGFNVTIQVKDGTHKGASITAPFVGNGTVTIQGNLTTPGNVIVDADVTANPVATFWVIRGAQVVLDSMEIRNTTTGHSIYAKWCGHIDYKNIRFGSAVASQVTVSFDGEIAAVGPSYIVGSAVAHFLVHSGFIRLDGWSLTLSGTPAFSVSFASVWGGKLLLNGVVFSGAATGRRFDITHGGLIFLGNAGDLTTLPGDVAGTVAEGSTYTSSVVVTPRETLVANRTYYVRIADGVDTNTGLTNTAGGAWATVAHALTFVQTHLDIPSGITVTIQVVGNPAEAVTLSGPFVGGGTVKLFGNATPSNCTWSSTICLTMLNNAVLTVGGFKITSSAVGFNITDGAILTLSDNMEFGANSSRALNAASGGAIRSPAATVLTLSGGGSSFVQTFLLGFVDIRSTSFTLSGTPAFATAFALAEKLGIIRFLGPTFSGSATGKRFDVQANGLIDTGGGASTYLPGNVAGTNATGGLYT